MPSTNPTAHSLPAMLHPGLIRVPALASLIRQLFDEGVDLTVGAETCEEAARRLLTLAEGSATEQKTRAKYGPAAG